MSKIDQLRRQREEQHARQQEQAAAPEAVSRAKAAPAREAEPEPAPEATSGAASEEARPADPGPSRPEAAKTARSSPLAARKPSKSKGTAEALEGDCSVCGKTRPLANGLVSNHQKGFGKMCAGSRKEPK